MTNHACVGLDRIKWKTHQFILCEITIPLTFRFLLTRYFDNSKAHVREKGKKFLDHVILYVFHIDILDFMLKNMKTVYIITVITKSELIIKFLFRVTKL